MSNVVVYVFIIIVIRSNSNKQCMNMPWFQVEELPRSKRFHHCENDACPSDKCRHHGRRIVKGPSDHLRSSRGLMASCGLWPPVAYGFLWLMPPCGLWPPVAHGLLWLMAFCGLWPPCSLIFLIFLCNLLPHYMVAW